MFNNRKHRYDFTYRGPVPKYQESRIPAWFVEGGVLVISIIIIAALHYFGVL